MKKQGDFSKKLNNVLFFLSGVLAVVLVGVVFINIQTKAKGDEIPDYLRSAEGTEQTAGAMSADVEKWQEGTINYNGKEYAFNQNLEVYLLMGIDKDGPVETASDGVSGGQSDALFLMVADKEQEELSVISINRNTITQIEAYDENGKSIGNKNSQICQQHSFGDGKTLSCARTVNAVSMLFYNLPINGYMSINMGAIGDINDAVGGVEVEVLQDINVPERNVALTAGQTKTLTHDEAYCYLRNSDIEKFDSATERLLRQEQYLDGFIQRIQSQSQANAALAMDIYDSVEDYLVTDIDFTELVKSLMSYEYSSERMYTVPGSTTKSDIYEEYVVDEERLYELIIKIFYEEVKYN